MSMAMKTLKNTTQMRSVASNARGASSSSMRVSAVSPFNSAASPLSAKAAMATASASVACKATTTQEAATTTTTEYGMNTLNVWLLKQEAAGTIDSEMAIMLSSIATACKQISSMVTRAAIADMTGLAGAENVQGEDQKKLDVISNEVFCNCLRASGRTSVIASEEEDTPVGVEETYAGNYICVFDPLDGSSNIDAGVSVGSIFGIYSETEQCLVDDDDEEKLAKCVTNVCQPGNNLLASGYCMYSSSCVLVLTVGDGVYGFTLDPSMGEFVLSHNNMKIPGKEGQKIYSFNEGNYAMWEEGLQNYMTSLKTGGAEQGSKPYSARYIGSLVGDFHRTLLYGGIYGYPGDSKNPNGKLRLLYECAPMSMIIEQAGGKGSTGRERILDIDPTEVHQRVPYFVGSKHEIDYLESFLK
ncbi:fructose-1,6-bisphosphatase I [Pseudoscourfieldia marina]